MSVWGRGRPRVREATVPPSSFKSRYVCLRKKGILNFSPLSPPMVSIMCRHKQHFIQFLRHQSFLQSCKVSSGFQRLLLLVIKSYLNNLLYHLYRSNLDKDLRREGGGVVFQPHTRSPGLHVYGAEECWKFRLTRVHPVIVPPD